MEDTNEPVSPDALEALVSDLSRGAIVKRASPSRTGKERRFLRGLGHHLKATALVGDKGLTVAAAGSVDALLARHELIKVNVLEGAPCTVGAAALWFHDRTGADVVQILGRTLLAYRARAEDPQIHLPSA